MGLSGLHIAAERVLWRITPHNVWGTSRSSSSFRNDVRIIDSCPGDAGVGRSLVDGFLTLGGAQCALTHVYHPGPETLAWLPHLHGFSWLRDLKALGGRDAAHTAKNLCALWIAAHAQGRGSPHIFSPGVTGSRLFQWSVHRSGLLSGMGNDLECALVSGACSLYHHLAATRGGINSVAHLRAIAGLLAAAASLCDSTRTERWRTCALTALKSALDAQILPDGGHVSRAPAALAAALAASLEAQSALSAASISIPNFLTEAITRMGQALRLFVYPDRGLALFHGTTQGAPAEIAALLAQAGAGPGARTPGNLPFMGYERAVHGRALLLMDVGASPLPGTDNRAHTAPLAFEFCYGPERVLTACGAHPLPGPWREALRATPAHCALTLDDRNACEIAPSGGLSRRVSHTAPVREDGAGVSLIESCHDGYVPLFGVIHRRRLFLAHRGHDLRGQELLTATTGAAPARTLPIAVRFHIHPRVSIALVQGGQEALLRIPGGAGWRFACAGARLVLEDSVYLGQGTRPRKTKQIALYSYMEAKTTHIRWALQRESA